MGSARSPVVAFALMNEPLHVLELGEGVASAYAARLLADHGAEVVKVEPPAGNSLRQRGPFLHNQPDEKANSQQSGLFLVLNLNKRGVVVDAIHGDEPALRALLEWADVLIHDLRDHSSRERSLDADTLALRYPQLVTLCITPFGSTGPYSEYAAEELTVTNAGGWASVCPATHTDPSLPPLKVFGHQCAMMSGIAGAMTTLAVIQDRRTGGVGEFIDLAQQDYVASVLEAGIPIYSYRGDVALRHSERSLIPWRTFQAKDAPIFIVCVEQDQWERLVDLMGNPEWAQLDIFADQPSRAENQDMVHSLVQEFVSGWEADALYHAAQERRICAAPVLTIKQMAENPHLRAREFFTTVAHPVTGTIECPASSILGSNGRAGFTRPAPKLGEHTAELLNNTSPRTQTPPPQPPPANTQKSTKPLAGVKVLDLTWVWAGTFGTMQLSHLGAEVIRLESALRPDLYRRLPVFPTDMNLVEGEEGLNRSGMFNQWSQGKRSVALDLGKPEGIELVKAFVAEADVVVQNFGTGVLDRLGLGYSVLRAIKPSIILASISGYGQTGPLKNYMGYGPAMPPLTGLSAATGYINGGPEEFGLSMPDPTAGLTAALAVVQALDTRYRTGKGDHLDISMWEATAALSIEAWMDYQFNGTQPERAGNRDPQMAPHGVFQCAGDDNWVSIACATDVQWQALANCIDMALARDKRFLTLELRKQHETDLEALVSDWCLSRDRWEITQELQAHGIATMPTLTTADIVNDSHLNQRQFIERLDHPEVGVRAHAGIPWRLRNRPNGVARPAPCLGADSHDVLEDVLGYSPERISQLQATGVLN